MQSLLKNKYNNGFTLAEVLVACAIVSTMVFALMLAVSKGVTLSNNALSQEKANLLLEEGAEAVKSIRDANWNNISNLTLDTNYYLSFSNAGSWSLATSPAEVVDSSFTRTVTVSQVFRDANDDISASGTIDAHTKKVNINVSWTNSDGSSNSRDLTFYLADIFN